MAASTYPWQQAAWRDILRRKAALPHALLLKGREGTGKLDFARTLARSLACHTPTADGAACGSCLSCRWFAAGNHPDYREVLPEAMRTQDAEHPGSETRKPSQEIRVEDVRELQDFINLSAHHANGKTIVICPAERMNVAASNALLKNLEEPPASTRFMLVAHRPSYLLPTIISRCQQISLPVPDTGVAEEWLRGQGVAEPLLGLAQTGNAPLAALALDDDFWAQRKSVLGRLAAPKLDALAAAELLRDIPVDRLLGWLQRWTYDLLSQKSMGRVRYNPDFHKDLSRVAAVLSATDIARCHGVYVEQQREVHHPLNARLFSEQLLLSYAALLRGKPGAAYAG